MKRFLAISNWDAEDGTDCVTGSAAADSEMASASASRGGKVKFSVAKKGMIYYLSHLQQILQYKFEPLPTQHAPRTVSTELNMREKVWKNVRDYTKNILRLF